MMFSLRHVALATGLVVVALVLAVAHHKYRSEQLLFFPKRDPVKLRASQSGLPNASDVHFQSGGATIHGWYVPSRNRAVVVLGHGAGANCAQLVTEARALVDAGFGVLLLDFPGHGESSGEIHWNEAERASLGAALDWLVAEHNVAPERIGGYGFSMGGYVVAQVAAEDTRLAAVALASTPADQREQVRFQHGRLWLLGELPALYALRRGGMDLDQRRPIDQVVKISPRAVLLIGGTDDKIVPPSMAGALYERAREPKQLLMVKGAGHGNYAQQDPSYLKKLRTFFEGALLGAKT